MTFFPGFTVDAARGAEVHLHAAGYKATDDAVAGWYNMIVTFIYGGVTQHGEVVGNVCADLNGMGGGARATRDGEHSVAPIFASMADIGEQELIEEEVPIMQARAAPRDEGQPGLRQVPRRPWLPADRHRQGQRDVGLHDLQHRLQVPDHARHLRRLRAGHLPAVQGQGRQRLRGDEGQARPAAVLDRGDHERAAVPGRHLHDAPHGHAARVGQDRRALHADPGRRRRLRRRARARPRDGRHRLQGRPDQPPHASRRSITW